MSPFVASWGGLSSLSLSHLQVIGYYVKFETEDAVPPLCCVLSEKSAQLVCFPFVDANHADALDCLVLPRTEQTHQGPFFFGFFGLV